MTNMKGQRTRAKNSFDSLEQEIFLNLWRTYDRLKGLEDQLFSRFELTPQQYNVLRLLELHQPEGMPTLRLASQLVSRAPDITRMLDKLDERGLIERHRPDDNRRVVTVRIKDKGKRLLEEIAEPLAQCHSQQLGHMSAAHLKSLGNLLRAARAPHELEESYWK